MIRSVFHDTAGITGMVLTMMLLVEHLNVRTGGLFSRGFGQRRWVQYLLSAALGSTPGCLGAFAVVALHTHGVVSTGALVAAMIATSGDEAYVMLSMFPAKAVVIFALLFVVGVVAGFLTDRVPTGITAHEPDHGFDFHEEDKPGGGAALGRSARVTVRRYFLLTILCVFALALTTGRLGPERWNWLRVTLLLCVVYAMVVVCTVSDHFLKDHLWDHVVKRHLPGVVLWTLGTLAVLRICETLCDIQFWVGRKPGLTLTIASLLGLIPESGPHLVVVALFSDGLIPASVLLANSIVQDGHAGLPLLAESRKVFFVVKAINLLVGLGVGLAGLALGL